MKKLFKHYTHNTLDRLSTLFFYLAILIFIIGFNFTDAPPPSGWYQQFMPNLNGQNIVDITFLDSLNGYAITGLHYILKTTNGGDNWDIIYNDTSTTIGFTRVEFVNQNTGFVSGGMYYSGTFHLLKTTNGGSNWYAINTPVTQYDMFVLNEDTIWITDGGGLGGLFRTTNGGQNWNVQYSVIGNNPNKIYMYNRNIGFACTDDQLFKTWNSGENWVVISDTSQRNRFFDIFFADSLTGWKTSFLTQPSDSNISMTTNGGLNWINQHLPSGGYISMFGRMTIFTNINKDTIWGAGGTLNYPNGNDRGFIYRTNNGGENWLLQIPDTNFGIVGFYSIQFLNKSIGWAFGGRPVSVYINIHTTSGGDTTFLTAIKEFRGSVPTHFLLIQNYPNPFNPVTKIKYQITKNKEKTANIKLAIYDITGKEVATLVDRKLFEGIYEVDFDGTNFSSGVYFYSLIVDGNLIDTKKMILLK